MAASAQRAISLPTKALPCSVKRRPKWGPRARLRTSLPWNRARPVPTGLSWIKRRFVPNQSMGRTAPLAFASLPLTQQGRTERPQASSLPVRYPAVPRKLLDLSRTPLADLISRATPEARVQRTRRPKCHRRRPRFPMAPARRQRQLLGSRPRSHRARRVRCYRARKEPSLRHRQVCLPLVPSTPLEPPRPLPLPDRRQALPAQPRPQTPPGQCQRWGRHRAVPRPRPPSRGLRFR